MEAKNMHYQQFQLSDDTSWFCALPWHSMDHTIKKPTDNRCVTVIFHQVNQSCCRLKKAEKKAKSIRWVGKVETSVRKVITSFQNSWNTYIPQISLVSLNTIPPYPKRKAARRTAHTKQINWRHRDRDENGSWMENWYKWPKWLYPLVLILHIFIV